MVSKAQKKAVLKYRTGHYDKICIEVKQGERDRWKAAAAACGLSLSKYLQALVDADAHQHIILRR